MDGGGALLLVKWWSVEATCNRSMLPLKANGASVRVFARPR